MYQRDRKYRKEGVRYEVISNGEAIGSGSFGKVYKIAATLSLDNNNYHYRKSGMDL